MHRKSKRVPPTPILHCLRKKNRQRGVRKLLVRLALLLATACVLVPRGFPWGSKPHSQIVDAALTAIPASDHLSLRLGAETQHLRNTVQMGDWVDSFIVADENWHVTTEDFPLLPVEYFGNDYLIFPSAPRAFSHIMPDVQGTYEPFFLRTLQALRTEDQANAARWMGSLLHFVTDSGSPPHAIGLTGPNHTKMENWLDASRIDLSGYEPKLLGSTDREALDGFEKRMHGLIARNAVIARQMIPLAEANDRAKIEPLALDCAAETARVSADVIHTLLVLSRPDARDPEASLVASITAPALPAHPMLPAKLVLLGTNFSTLSAFESLRSDRYTGSFLLTHLPAGTYRAAIERPGAQTIFTEPFILTAGREMVLNWQMQPSEPANNIVQNPDFKLHWVSASAADHWHFDRQSGAWLSDNIPVTVGVSYNVSVDSHTAVVRSVTLEWMAQHWLKADVPAVVVGKTPVAIRAPNAAVYARFKIAGEAPPANDLHRVALIPVPSDSVTLNQQ